MRVPEDTENRQVAGYDIIAAAHYTQSRQVRAEDKVAIDDCCLAILDVNSPEVAAIHGDVCDAYVGGFVAQIDKLDARSKIVLPKKAHFDVVEFNTAHKLPTVPILTLQIRVAQNIVFVICSNQD